MLNLPFKLTFNLPAAQRYFEGESVTGARIKIENEKVFFSPLVGERTADSVTFSKRARGGFEVMIEGKFSSELYAILTKDASFTHPFFLLKKADNNSATLMHYTELGAPPKFAPHMRVWLPRKMHNSSKTTPIKDEINDILGPFTSVIRASKQIVDDRAEARKIGRPNREVDEAKSVMTAFENLAYEIIPGLHSETKIQQLRDASTLLNDFLKEASAMSASMKSKSESLKAFATEMHGDLAEPLVKVKPRTVAEYAESNTIQQIPMKRGRGRPRKIQPVAHEEILASELEAAPEPISSEEEAVDVAAIVNDAPQVSDDHIDLGDYRNTETVGGAEVIQMEEKSEDRPVKFWKKNHRVSVNSRR